MIFTKIYNEGDETMVLATLMLFLE